MTLCPFCKECLEFAVEGEILYCPNEDCGAEWQLSIPSVKDYADTVVKGILIDECKEMD